MPTDAASILRKWMPYFLLPLYTYLPQSDLVLATSLSFTLILLGIFMKAGGRWGAMCICAPLSYYEPFAIAASIVLARRKDGYPTIIPIWAALFLLISVFPPPLWAGAIYFWGIPFLAILSLCVARLLQHIGEKRLTLACLSVVLAATGTEAFIIACDSGVHYGSPNVHLSDNFIRNAISSGRFLLEDNAELENNDKTTSFVFSPGLTERDIATRKTGKYYLLGEHDNMNGFVMLNRSFNNDSIRQHEPWAFNRPCMAAFLRIASMKDSFYCSNLGGTLKRECCLTPFAWRYDAWGIPRILLGERTEDEKEVILIGDSDIAVSFLAPYNASFLSALYHQDWMIVLPYILALLAVLVAYALNSRVVYVAILALPLLYFIDPSPNKNEFDAIVRFEGITIKSPHTDNSPDKIVNNLSRLGKTVHVGKGNAKNVIYVIANDFKLGELKERGIIFLMPGATLRFNGKFYFVKNIPLGVKKEGSIAVPDARGIVIDDKEQDSSLVTSGNAIIIGTGSPQDMADITRLMK